MLATFYMLTSSACLQTMVLPSNGIHIEPWVSWQLQWRNVSNSRAWLHNFIIYNGCIYITYILSKIFINVFVDSAGKKQCLQMKGSFQLQTKHSIVVNGWLHNCIIHIWINIPANMVSSIFINVFVNSVGKKQYAYDNLILLYSFYLPKS